MRKLTRSTSVIAGGVLATTLVGVAYAAWTSNGSGSGTATSFDTTTSTIEASTALSDVKLYPGGTGQMTVKITNKNPYPAYVSSISSGKSAVAGTCAAETVTSDADAAPNNTVLAPGASRDYPLVTHMVATAGNECRAQDFTLSLTAVLTTGS